MPSETDSSPSNYDFTVDLSVAKRRTSTQINIEYTIEQGPVAIATPPQEIEYNFDVLPQGISNLEDVLSQAAGTAQSRVVEEISRATGLPQSIVNSAVATSGSGLPSQLPFNASDFRELVIEGFEVTNPATTPNRSVPPASTSASIFLPRIEIPVPSEIAQDITPVDVLPFDITLEFEATPQNTGQPNRFFGLSQGETATVDINIGPDDFVQIRDIGDVNCNATFSDTVRELISANSTLENTLSDIQNLNNELTGINDDIMNEFDFDPKTADFSNVNSEMSPDEIRTKMREINNQVDSAIEDRLSEFTSGIPSSADEIASVNIPSQALSVLGCSDDISEIDEYNTLKSSIDNQLGTTQTLKNEVTLDIPERISLDCGPRVDDLIGDTLRELPGSNPSVSQIREAVGDNPMAVADDGSAVSSSSIIGERLNELEGSDESCVGEARTKLKDEAERLGSIFRDKREAVRGVCDNLTSDLDSLRNDVNSLTSSSVIELSDIRELRNRRDDIESRFRDAVADEGSLPCEAAVSSRLDTLESDISRIETRGGGPAGSCIEIWGGIESKIRNYEASINSTNASAQSEFVNLQEDFTEALLEDLNISPSGLTSGGVINVGALGVSVDEVKGAIQDVFDEDQYFNNINIESTDRQRFEAKIATGRTTRNDCFERFSSTYEEVDSRFADLRQAVGRPLRGARIAPDSSGISKGTWSWPALGSQYRRNDNIPVDVVTLGTRVLPSGQMFIEEAVFRNILPVPVQLTIYGVRVGEDRRDEGWEKLSTVSLSPGSIESSSRPLGSETFFPGTSPAQSVSHSWHVEISTSWGDGWDTPDDFPPEWEGATLAVVDNIKSTNTNRTSNAELRDLEDEMSRRGPVSLPAQENRDISFMIADNITGFLDEGNIPDDLLEAIEQFIQNARDFIDRDIVNRSEEEVNNLINRANELISRIQSEVLDGNPAKEEQINRIQDMISRLQDLETVGDLTFEDLSGDLPDRINSFLDDVDEFLGLNIDDREVSRRDELVNQGQTLLRDIQNQVGDDNPIRSEAVATVEDNIDRLNNAEFGLAALPDALESEIRGYLSDADVFLDKSSSQRSASAKDSLIETGQNLISRIEEVSSSNPGKDRSLDVVSSKLNEVRNAELDIDVSDISRELRNAVAEFEAAVDQFGNRRQIARTEDKKNDLQSEGTSLLDRIRSEVSSRNPGRENMLNRVNSALDELTSISIRPETALPCDERFPDVGSELEAVREEVASLSAPVSPSKLSTINDSINEVTNLIESNVPAGDPCRRELERELDRLVDRAQSLTTRVRVEKGEGSDAQARREELLDEILGSLEEVNTNGSS